MEIPYYIVAHALYNEYAWWNCFQKSGLQYDKIKIDFSIGVEQLGNLFRRHNLQLTDLYNILHVYIAMASTQSIKIEYAIQFINQKLTETKQNTVQKQHDENINEYRQLKIKYDNLEKKYNKMKLKNDQLLTTCSNICTLNNTKKLSPVKKKTCDLFDNDSEF